jgi:putative copper export protein
MIGLSWDSTRLFLHVLAATIWVGGQLTLGALVPALRAAGPDVPRVAAQAFNRIAWPAFGVLIATGVWNIVAEQDQNVGAYKTTLNVKMAVVLVSGVTAYLHTKATTPRGRGVYGALTALSALAALLLGILLAG